MSTCNCMGPQNGQPLCPCRMRDVKTIDGRYVRVEDLGPDPTAEEPRITYYTSHPHTLDSINIPTPVDILPKTK